MQEIEFLKSDTLYNLIIILVQNKPLQEISLSSVQY